MFKHCLKTLAAGLLAAGLTAAPAQAAIEIQVIELQNGQPAGGGPPVLLQRIDPGNGETPYYQGTSFFDRIYVTTTRSGSGSLVGTLTTTYNVVTPSTGFDLTAGAGIGIIVTATDFKQGGGQTAVVTNDVGASTGIGTGSGGLGTNTVQNTIQILNNAGTTIFTTGSVTDAAGPGASGSSDPLQETFGPFPDPYTIKQLITITASGSGSITGEATFAGTISATVDPNAVPNTPVPGPAGIVLAAIALPLVGLRRAARKAAAKG